jgi:hypothetical protein
MYQVGLGDTPMKIARRFTGQPTRYRELLYSNPHKSVVHVGGVPTFASLGVGERIELPAGWLAGSYADDLAAVGLHPDNPDGMYSALMLFLANPLKFKQADKCWPGTRDNLSWWEEPKGVAHLIWPFFGGKWLTEGPKNEAQIRAVFKIPAGVGTKEGLSRLYGFPFRSDLSYSLALQSHSCDGGGFDLGSAVGQAWNVVQQGIAKVGDVAAALRIPGANLVTALATGKDPVAALKADIKDFADSANLAKNVVSGNFDAVAADLTARAKKLGIDLPPAAVQAAVSAAKSGATPDQIATTALGSNYADAWKVATNGGQIASSLPAPPGFSYKVGASADASAHPITVAAKKVIALGPVAPAQPPATTAAAPAKAATTPAPAPSAQAPAGASSYGPYPAYR